VSRTTTRHRPPIAWRAASEWSETTIHRARTGYVVTHRSFVQGEPFDLVRLVRYGNDQLRPSRERNLNDRWNDIETYGSALARLALDPTIRRDPAIRTLRHGMTVQ